MNKGNVYFILDGSQLASNVAQAARAMGNFGFHNLRLVNPMNLPSAERMARGGSEVVRGAELFTDLDSALKDLSWVVGTTGKDGIGQEELVRPEIAVAEAAGLSGQTKVGIVFGCERHGLTNAQLKTLDRLAHVPTQPECSSINLAQSVAIFAWELDKQNIGPARPLDLGLPTHQKKSQLFVKVNRAFTLLGGLPEGRKAVLADGLRQYFNRQPMTDKDLGFWLRTLNLLQKTLDGTAPAPKPAPGPAESEKTGR
jgi:TrmH family RNA methyltransferase